MRGLSVRLSQEMLSQGRHQVYLQVECGWGEWSSASEGHADKPRRETKRRSTTAFRIASRRTRTCRRTGAVIAVTCYPSVGRTLSNVQVSPLSGPWWSKRFFSECALTCHQTCSHLVPDFCGMTMEMANILLKNLRDIKTTQVHKKPPSSVASSTTSSVSTLPVYQPQAPERPSPPQQQLSTPQVPQRPPPGAFGPTDPRDGRFGTPPPQQQTLQPYPQQAEQPGPRMAGARPMPQPPAPPQHRLSYQDGKPQDEMPMVSAL